MPAGVVVPAPLSGVTSVQAGWFRMADRMDDSKTNTDDQADFLFAKLPFGKENSRLAPENMN